MWKDGKPAGGRNACFELLRMQGWKGGKGGFGFVLWGLCGEGDDNTGCYGVMFDFWIFLKTRNDNDMRLELRFSFFFSKKISNFSMGISYEDNRS